MRTIDLKGTDLKLSRLGFGTASLHHILKESKRLDLLSKAYESGFTHFDTARMYGEGMAERTLGKFLSNGLRQKVTIASKFGIPANPIFDMFPLLMYASRIMNRFVPLKTAIKEPSRRLSVKEVESSLSKSLKALQTDWLDIYFLHEPKTDDIATLHALVPWLQKQKEEGHIRYLGLSGEVDNCLAIDQAFPGIFDVFQVEDSVDGGEANVMIATGKPLQLTFGYMRNSGSADKMAIMKNALKQNLDGCMLVSTRNTSNLSQLRTLVDTEVELEK